METEGRKQINDLSRATQKVRVVEGTPTHVCLISRITQMPLGPEGCAVGLPWALWDSFSLYSLAPGPPHFHSAHSPPPERSAGPTSTLSCEGLIRQPHLS